MKTRKMLHEHVVTLVEFGGHILAGCVLFMLIGLAALGLELFTGWLGSMGMSESAVKVLKFVEFGMLWLDVVLMGLWVAVSSFKASRELLEFKR
jgi:hypothetical protein